MRPFCRMRRGNYAQQSILTQNSVSFQTRPNLKKSKWSAQLLMPLFCLFGDLIQKHPQHVEETEKPFSQCSTLKLQNIFWGKSCKYSFKAISLVWLIVTFRQSHTSYHQGSEEGHAQDGLRQHLPCSPRMVMSDVDPWLGRYLTVRSYAALRATEAILHVALLFHNNNSQQLGVLPEHWGMSSPPPSPRLAGDFCPNQMPAPIIPTRSTHHTNPQPAGCQWALLSWRDSFSDLPLPSSTSHNTSSMNALGDYFWDWGLCTE